MADKELTAGLNQVKKDDNQVNEVKEVEDVKDVKVADNDFSEVKEDVSEVEMEVARALNNFASEERNTTGKEIRATIALVDEVKCTFPPEGIEKRKEERMKKVLKLKEFSACFKLNTPVPKDILSLMTKDPAKQQELLTKSLRNHEECKAKSLRPNIPNDPIVIPDSAYLAETCERLLRDILKEEVFNILIDCFRLRSTERLCGNGNGNGHGLETPGVALAGEPTAAYALTFERMLRRAERMDGLMPSWWNEGERKICEAKATDRNHWPNIFAYITATNIALGYEDVSMAYKMRLLGIYIYGDLQSYDRV